VVRREADRPRVGADVREAERPHLLDEQAQHAVADGRVADRGALLRRDAHRDELLDRTTVRREHAEGPVARAGDLDGELDDALEHGVERRAPTRGSSRPRSARDLAGWAGSAPTWAKA
jgi:hypothetical protein